MSSGLSAPTILAPHFVERFYEASGRMSAFRGAPGGRFDSEEWIGSTTTVFGGTPDEGLSLLPDGSTLRSLIEQDPVAALGPEHVARFGTSTELLLKIIDAGQRLPVHVHPDREFAHAHLGSVHGKTEAWVILDAPPGSSVFVGFRRPVERAELLTLIDDQNSTAMLEAMHELPVRAGDTVLVPAGLPHAIGAGLVLAELQEPADYSMMLEWKGYALDAAATGRLGLPMAEAIDCVNTSGITLDAVERLRGRVAQGAGAAGQSVLSPLADPYFRATVVDGDAVLDPAYSILLVTEGKLTLETEAGTRIGTGTRTGTRTREEYATGQAVLVPAATGEVTVSGDGRGLRFQPPAAGASILQPAG